MQGTCLQHVNTSTSGLTSKVGQAHLESAAETEAFPQYGLQWIFGVTYVLRLQAERIYESNSQIFEATLFKPEFLATTTMLPES